MISSPNLSTALFYLYISGGIAQLTGNHDSLFYIGKVLAYSGEVEISRRIHKSFAITWKDLEVTILELLPNTDLDSICIYTKRILYYNPMVSNEQ